MHVSGMLSRLAIIALLVIVAETSRAQEPLRQEDTFVRIKLGGRDVRLEALIVRPEVAEGRLPLALITHGKPPSSVGMGDVRPAAYAGVARDFARRGWLAAVVIRRGFGQSDGPMPQATSCANLNFPGRFDTDGDELQKALEALQGRDDVDPNRAIAIGSSAGGAAVLALASRKPPGLRGVINVSGGLNIEGCVEQGRDALVDVVKGWQRPGTPPQLWIYAKNDGLFPPSLVDRMRGAALDAGGDIRFIGLPEIKPDGHQIFSRSLGRYSWLHELDSSLRAWGLPTWSPARARQYFAKLGFTERAGAFERYFAAPGEKAMVLSPSRKQFHYWFGAPSLDRAKERALHDCAKAATDCLVAFENNQSVLPD
jgi:dienelactone hydrolase